MAYQDVAAFLRDILKDNWQIKNTANHMPTFEKVIDVKRERFGKNADWILTYNVSAPQKDWGLGDQYRKLLYRATIDIRTMESDKRIVKYIREIARVLNNYSVIKSTYTLGAEQNEYTFEGILKILDTRDMSNKSSNLYRFTMDIEIENRELKNT